MPRPWDNPSFGKPKRRERERAAWRTSREIMRYAQNERVAERARLAVLANHNHLVQSSRRYRWRQLVLYYLGRIRATAALFWDRLGRTRVPFLR